MFLKYSRLLLVSVCGLELRVNHRIYLMQSQCFSHWRQTNREVTMAFGQCQSLVWGKLHLQLLWARVNQKKNCHWHLHTDTHISMWHVWHSCLSHWSLATKWYLETNNIKHYYGAVYRKWYTFFDYFHSIFNVHVQGLQTNIKHLWL